MGTLAPIKQPGPSGQATSLFELSEQIHATVSHTKDTAVRTTHAFGDVKEHHYYSYYLPTTFAPSYKPQAGQLHELDTSSRTSQHRTSPSRTTWTRHEKERETKAPQPRVAKMEKRAT